MSSFRRCGSLLLVALVGMPAGKGLSHERAPRWTEPVEQEPLAQRGGHGGPFRHGHGSGGRDQRGFGGYGGHRNRGHSLPSGGWYRRQEDRRSRPLINRRGRFGGGPDGPGWATRDLPRPTDLWNRDRFRGYELDLDGRRDLNRGWDRERRVDVERRWNRDINRRPDRRRDGNRRWNRRVDVRDVNVWPGWARPGWGLARPWRHGWYGSWRTPSWGWWEVSAAAWSIFTLATAAAINEAMDRAVESRTTTIVVPDTGYRLLFGTVQPVNDVSVSFAVMAADATYRLTADCASGLLEGRPPETAEEAELLHAACQVAFGSP